MIIILSYLWQTLNGKKKLKDLWKTTSSHKQEHGMGFIKSYFSFKKRYMMTNLHLITYNNFLYMQQ